ncbi:MAG: HAD-IA family hydrolase [Candidatus Cyclobacteriaceae bacterium M3_2C_046]
MEALLFDCDGVLVDTERDGHRVAFNQAFAMKGISVVWQADEYKQLVKVAGGKERMKFYFNQHGWPANVGNREDLIKELHLLKTKLFMQLIEKGSLPLRPGIARLVDEAIASDIQLAVCSTSNEKAVSRIVEVLLGKERQQYFRGIFAGDMVPRKKPDPAVYNLCRQKLELDPKKCVVVEDSRNGLLAAKAAGFHCIITYNDYTREEDFKEADLVVTELGDKPVQVNLARLNQLLTN